MSQVLRAKISALGTYVPPRLLTNADLERMVETNNEWIMERTGIRERHLVDKGVATSDLAVEAAKKALPNAASRQVTSTPLSSPRSLPTCFPATASLGPTQTGCEERLGIPFRGLLRVCLCFTNRRPISIATGAHKQVMVIGADVMSSIIDYTDRATCCNFWRWRRSCNS